jgi:hypothetical protein
MLFDTYTPVQLAAVREADKARIKGRRRLRLSKIADGIESERRPQREQKWEISDFARRPRSSGTDIKGTGRTGRESLRSMG